MARKFTSTSRLEFPSVTAASFPGGMTLSCWLRMDTEALGRDQPLMQFGDAFSASAPMLFWRDRFAAVAGRGNTLAVLLRTNAGTLRVEGVEDVLNDEDWRHVAAVYEPSVGDGLRLFVDGVRCPDTASTIGHTRVMSSALPLRVARGYAGNELSSSLAEVAVFGSGLTDVEVLSLAKGLSPLGLTRHGGSLRTYQSLIRRPNHPGCGAPAAMVGTPGVSAHPRVFYPTAGHAAFAGRSLGRSHYLEESVAAVSGGRAGATAVAGFGYSNDSLAAEVIG